MRRDERDEEVRPEGKRRFAGGDMKKERKRSIEEGRVLVSDVAMEGYSRSPPFATRVRRSLIVLA